MLATYNVSIHCIQSSSRTVASVEKRIVISPVDGDILVRSDSFYFFYFILVFVASRMSRN